MKDITKQGKQIEFNLSCMKTMLMLMLKSNKVSNCKNINYVTHYSKYIK